CSMYFFFSSRRRHTSFSRDWSSDVCSSDLVSGVSVSASTHEIYNIRDLKIEEGRYFSEGESSRGSTVAIIGSTIAEGLFPNGNRSEERRVGIECIYGSEMHKK